jgi:DNA-directed RNA polymerase specialized sigma24 family protein
MRSDSSVGIEDLERRPRGGDQEALAELFSRERERRWRVVHFRLPEPLQGRLGPEDVLQEAFLAASQR